MQYKITQQEAGFLEAEVFIPLLDVQKQNNTLLQHYQQKKVDLPTPAVLKQQLHQFLAQQAIKKICKQEQKTIWEPPEWEVLKSTQDLILRISLEVLPEVKLEGYQNLSVEVPPVPIPSQEALITRTLDQQYALAHVEKVERPIEMGDRVVLDLLTWHQESPLPMASRANLEVMVFEGAFAPGFSEALIGLRAGEEKQIKSTISSDFHIEAYRGQPVIYDVSINHVFSQQLPPVEELPGLLDFENIDEMMDYLYQEKLEENQDNWLKLVRRHLVLQVANASTFEIPEPLLEAELISRWEQKEAPQLEKQDLSEDIQDAALERWIEEETIQKEIYIDLASGLVIRALAHKENITLSPPDVLWALKPFLDSFEMAPEELIQEMQRSGQLETFCDQLASEMVIDYLYDQAELICEGEVIKAPYEDTTEDDSSQQHVQLSTSENQTSASS